MEKVVRERERVRDGDLDRDRDRDRDEGRRTASRQEGRESEIKRHNSKADKEPSPKRSRRDGKPATERTASGNHEMDMAHRSDHDQKHRRRLQDAVPLEAPLEPDSKVVPDVANQKPTKETDVPTGHTKPSSDPTKVPRARTYFQHDERGSAGQDGRSFSRRATNERGDTTVRSSDKSGGNKTNVDNLRNRDDKIPTRGDEKSVWAHDRFQELEVGALPPSRKRPFREKKIEAEGNTAGVTTRESGRESRPVLDNVRKEERAGRYSHESDRPEKPFTRTWAPPPRGDTQRFGFSSRERFNGVDGPRGRDRISGRYGERNQYRSNNARVEKWKHDLYDEASKSSPTKNEEDQIAKVEALLAL